jgi:hypothetical protein
MIKKYLDKIVQNGKQEDMDELGDIFSDVMHELKEYNKSDYMEYKHKLCGMAYNYQIDEEMAHEIVEDMKPLGEYWNIDAVKSVIGNTTHTLADMYVVMNSLANDYQSIISLEDTDTYIKMAYAWLDDIDGKKHKVWKYFVDS